MAEKLTHEKRLDILERAVTHGLSLDLDEHAKALGYTDEPEPEKEEED